MLIHLHICYLFNILKRSVCIFFTSCCNWCKKIQNFKIIHYFYIFLYTFLTFLELALKCLTLSKENLNHLTFKIFCKIGCIFLLQDSHRVQPVPFVGVPDPVAVEPTVEVSFLLGHIYIHSRIVCSWWIFQQTCLGLSARKGTKPVRSLDTEVEKLSFCSYHTLLL